MSKQFFADSSGAVSVDWVVLAVGIFGMVLAALTFAPVGHEDISHNRLPTDGITLTGR